MSKINLLCLMTCLSYLFFFYSAGAQTKGAEELGQAQDQAVSILKDLIRIDTSNPPGNEFEAAKYLKKYFDNAGIESKIYDSSPGRGNLIARLRGDGTKEPLLLVSHLDVVGVERAHWKLDPFKAEIKNGRIYGRGSSDIKDLTAVQLVTMLLLKRSSTPLHRDIIFVSVADEESGGKMGMKYLVENHWEEIKAEYAFNEGSRGKPYLKDGRVKWASLQVTERRSVNLRVIAHGTSAHSMLQMPDNALFTLAKALDRVSQYHPPMRLNSASRQYIEGIARLEQRPKNWYKSASAGSSEEGRGLYSMLHTTINPTTMKGGFRNNVIPADAEANLNCRLLPDVSINELISDLKKVIRDSKVSIEIEGETPTQTPISPTDNAAVKAYEKVIKNTFGQDVLFIPTIGAGATDSRFLRARGMPSYALEPFVDNEAQNAHGNDESISLEGFRGGLKLYYSFLKELAQ